MALVNFRYGTAAEYAALATKDPNTLYFVADEHKIYKGDTSYGGSEYAAVTDFPETPVTGTLYINTATGEVKYFNGTAYVVVVKPSPATMSATPDGNTLATQKAVADYIATKLTDLDVSALDTRLTTAESDIDNLETGKADKATTLAGYGIADAYTKDDTDSAIATAVASASHLKREIVTTLPEVADADENTIYMIAKTGGSGTQQYDEYFLVNGAFEKIGDTAVDLTDYAKTTDVTAAITASETATKTAYEAADATNLQSAKDYADGLATNYATKAQGDKADTAVQEVVEGTTNGTISVDSNEVAVHGLGSAAFTDSSAYDAAGAANTALTSAKSYADTLLTWGAIE